MFGATLNFLYNGKKIKFPLFLFLILFIQILSVSCTIWPVVTALAAPQSGSSNDNGSLVLLAILQNGTTGSSSASESTGGSVGSGCSQSSSCAIFLYNHPFAIGGNWGGISGADAKCASGASGAGAPGDPNSYKALLMAEDGSRNLTTDWVLYPNKVYKSISNSNLTVTSTDANGQFIFPVTNTITTTANGVYTGIDTSGATWVPKTGQTCLSGGVSWTSTSTVVNGSFGISNGNGSLGSALVDDAGLGFACNNTLVLYCVQR
ncbi:DUF1554 domain-containing protein [Leptospira yasudae]|uniref:DUF1554 domain-containing protein n=1 Tax=Leptospira yasudae TaxID=2202201 RepID=A0ABX9M8G5_9LEPT|nr:DUF1554 domain-containing protein [Leptospira yasudae]RHX82032.1 hypothetical protein DLM77_00755 [Leptospira yasudae]TGK30593.1 DUF1554 domain-containing protein [Leptospira yasudae]TGM04027.1 DUF1554 domain-containing protein [Leptospira yasudae]